MYKNAKKISRDITIAENLRKHYNLVILGNCGFCEKKRNHYFQKKGRNIIMKERKAFKKNKGLVKRLFSFVLALALVLNMGQIMPTAVVEAAETYEVTFHYLNDKNYSSLGFYAWLNGDLAGGWPGKTMVQNTLNTKWYDCKLTVPATTINYIVNRNGGQTDDFTIDLSSKPAEVWLKGTVEKGNGYKMDATTTAPSGWAVPQEPSITYDATIHFYNNYGWDKVSFYAWDKSENCIAAWPGQTITENAVENEWYDVQIEDFHEDKINVIFNDTNGAQTKDVSVNLTKGSDVWVVNSKAYYEKPSGDTLELDTYKVTFHYNNDVNKWASVALWAWDDNANYTGGNWPGKLFKATEGKTGWYDATIYGVNSSVLKFHINNNNNGSETATHILNLKSFKSEYWVTGGVANPTISETAPESWNPQPSVPEKKEYTATMHFLNNAEWETVGLYAWHGEGEGTVKLKGEWPGEVLVEDENHSGWYTGTVVGDEAREIKYIFNNNNGAQTDDLIATLSEGTNEYWVVNGIAYTEEPQAWAEDVKVEPYDVTVHYYKPDSWSGVNFYAWAPSQITNDWPGNALRENAKYKGWYDYKVEDLFATKLNFKYSNPINSEDSTGDVSADLSSRPEEVWVYKVGNQIKVETVAPETWVETPEVKDPSATIHFLNNFNWDEVGCYAWHGAGTNSVELKGGWPGTATGDANQEGWHTVTFEDLTEEKFSVIFNNMLPDPEKQQTSDLAIDLANGKEIWVANDTVYYAEPSDEELNKGKDLLFHFYNNKGWSEVAFYAWYGNGDSSIKFAGDWPGTVVENTEDLWFDATVSNYMKDEIKIIFNNNDNNEQTADLVVNLTLGEEIWVANGKVFYEEPTDEDLIVEEPTSFDIVVHYKNSNWSNFNFYCWDGNGGQPAGTWPGTPATANPKNVGWHDFFLNDFKGTFNFIWNNGADGDQNKTKDLSYDVTEGYTEIWVDGENITTTAPDGWVKTYTVKLHFNKPEQWSNIHLYAWYGLNSEIAGTWPGSLATENACNPGWYDYTIADTVDPNFKQVWNVGSDSKKTADLSLPKALTKAYTELWVVGNEVTDVEPETWSNRLPVTERDVYVPGTLPGPAWDPTSNKMEYLGDGIYKFELKNVPAANYEYKIAIGGNWDENYGANGAAGGDNISLIVPSAQDVTIYYSDVTHFAVDSINYIFADITLSGKNIAEEKKLTDEGLTGIYSVSVNLPADTYEDVKLTYDGKEYKFAKFIVSEEKKVTFCMDPVSGLFYHDGSANKVNASALYFDSKSTEYKSVFGAVATGEEVRFSITTGTDVTSASLFFKGMENKAVAMSKDGEVVNGKQKWSVTTSLSRIGEYDYYFAVSNGADVCVYGDDDGYYGTGKTSGLMNVMPYDLVVYKAGFTTPDWMKNGVIYQIFPDRFFDGNPSNNKAQLSARGDVNYEFIEDWSIIPENPEQEGLLDRETYEDRGAFWGDGQWSNEIYGGDLDGITQRIDYLKALGVTVIYLNPVFHSISSHRYDACDYTKIDPILGTEGDFTELVTIAEQNGMTVVLDGVFNHVSDDSIYFDRYYKFIDDGLATIGAYPYWAYVYDYMAENGVSQTAAETAARQHFTSTYGVTDYSYTEWFYVSSEYMKDDKENIVKDKIGQRAGKPVYTYEGWWGYDSMPVIKSTNGSEYQTGNWAEDIIYNAEGTSVTQYWISKGMDGWRLDVANEVSDETWQEFRKSVKSLDSEAVIIGEIWTDATKYILGDMYDSVMNYQFRNAVTSFAMGSDAATVTKQMEKIRERYPREAFYAMMNLVGSHDTSRILSYLDGIGDDRNDKSIDAAFPTYEKTSALAKQRQYLVAFLQFTYAGAPTIYYGDEVGVVGCDDPDDRRTFPWGQGAEELVTYYATLAQIRSAYPALRTGSVETISTGNGKVMGYVRAEGEEVVVVLANNATSTQQVVVDVAKYGITAEELQDMLGATVYEVVNGKVTVTVPALRGVILVEEAKAINVDVDALAPAFDEEAAKRPVTPAPTPSNPSTPSTPSVPSVTPDAEEETQTPAQTPDETPEEEADVEEIPEDEDVTEDATAETEDVTTRAEETEEVPSKDVPKEEKTVEEMVADSEGAWTTIIEKVTENAGKANITVQVAEDVQVPASFIQSIAGQNIDVVIEMPNGIVWTINSDTVTGNTVDVNFHVDVDTHNIPEDVVKDLADDKEVIQLSLAHSGEFGCQPVLTVPMGSENAGKYANLFYYNEKTGVMEFMTYGLIGEDGKVDLQFIHASEYAVVIDTQVMGTVIDGVDAPLGDINAGPSPLIFIILIACVAVGAVAICYGFRKKEDRA